MNMGESPTKEFYGKREKVAKIIYDGCRKEGIEDLNAFVSWSKCRVDIKEMYRSIANKVMYFVIDKWGSV